MLIMSRIAAPLPFAWWVQAVRIYMLRYQPEYALYGFAVFYAVCLVLNWWFYLGPKAEIKNP